MNDKTTLYVETTFRIVGTIKGQELVRRETVMLEVPLAKFEDLEFCLDLRRVFYAILETQVKNQLAQVFIQKLKTSTETKRRIGGTKWSVDLVGPIEEMPLYTEEAKIGDWTKFVNTKNPYNILREIVHRNSAIIESLYKAKAAANDGEGKQAA